MTFNETFLHLALAASIFGIFQTMTEDEMSRSIRSGKITMLFIKPMDYQVYIFITRIGMLLTNIICIMIPSIFMIMFLYKSKILLEINILLFIVALIFSFLISFTIDFTIGLFSFYTESIWGITTTKDAIILLLSGAIIPLNFFPEYIRKILELLPFRAIYNIPLKILIDKNLIFIDYIKLLLTQFFWVLIMLYVSRIFLNKAKKIVTINGG